MLALQLKNMGENYNFYAYLTNPVWRLVHVLELDTPGFETQLHDGKLCDLG